jgi:hypothetical protein
VLRAPVAAAPKARWARVKSSREVTRVGELPMLPVHQEQDGVVVNQETLQWTALALVIGLGIRDLGSVVGTPTRLESTFSI